MQLVQIPNGVQEVLFKVSVVQVSGAIMEQVLPMTQGINANWVISALQELFCQSDVLRANTPQQLEPK